MKTLLILLTLIPFFQAKAQTKYEFIENVCYEGILRPGKLTLNDLKKAVELKPVHFAPDTIIALEVVFIEMQIISAGLSTYYKINGCQGKLSAEMINAFNSLSFGNEIIFNIFVKDTSYVASKVLPVHIKIAGRTIYEYCMDGNTTKCNVYFDTAKDVLGEQEKELLRLLSFYLNNNPVYTINVLGFADTIGGKNNNQLLSEKRAETVTNYLISNGIAKERINFTGHGSKPSDENLITERRVEIEIIRP